MTRLRIFVLSVALLSPLAASAQSTVFKCTDRKGSVTYTNDRTLGKNCTPLAGDLPVSTVPAPPASSAAGANPPRTATPGDFPRVTSNDQRSRDDSRLQILEQELQSEQAALANAREKLKTEEGRIAPEDRNVMRDGRATINEAKREERLQPLRNQVELHERNIDALQRELSRLR